MNGLTTGSADAPLILSGVTLAGMFAGADAGVLIGSFAGAMVYVLSSTELSRWSRLGYGLASFLIGIVSADLATGIITYMVGDFLPAGVTVSRAVGATVSATLGVCVLLALKKMDILSLLGRFISGGR